MMVVTTSRLVQVDQLHFFLVIKVECVAHSAVLVLAGATLYVRVLYCDIMYTWISQ